MSDGFKGVSAAEQVLELLEAPMGFRLTRPGYVARVPPALGRKAALKSGAAHVLIPWQVRHGAHADP